MTRLNPQDLRAAFGRFMTGVTVVTTRDPSGTPLGFTANAFTSVSLDPPLLLICPGKFLSSYTTFASCTHFAVNILAEGQEDVANTFASFKGDRFGRVLHHDDPNGVPVIDGAVAQFSCTTHDVVEAGDHCVLIGRVDEVLDHDAPGLGYENGRYFSLGLERGSLEPTDRQVICGAIVEVGGQVLLERVGGHYRPPQISRSGRANLRRDLQDALLALGIEARLGAAYSVFDDPTTHSAYILATAERLPEMGPLRAVDVGDLSQLTWATQPIADMMRRYAVEAQTRNFSLYLGDALCGETHSLSERN